MAAGPFLEETIALLERTPRTLSALLSGLPDSWLAEPDVPGGWRPRDVVGHLISAEQSVWIARVETLLDHGTGRAFDGFDRFQHVERDAGVPLPRLVEDFAELRALSLARLSGLVHEEADLDRVGLHPEFGEVRLRQLLSAWTVHDLDHLQQLFPALAGSRDREVGPWKAYLGILSRRDQAPVS